MPQYSKPRKKKKERGLLEDIAMGTWETPLSVLSGLGGGLLALPEAAFRGLDWSDRPEWLAPSLTPRGEKGTGVEGAPLWSSEEAKKGLTEAMDRWTYKPKSESGKVSTDVANKAIGLIDRPFQMFGEGVGDITGVPELGDAAYWATSILGPAKGASGIASLSRKGAGVLADKSQIMRKGWYGGPASAAVAKGVLPIEMAGSAAKASVHPIAGLRYSETGISPAAAKRMQKTEAEIASGKGNTGKLTREHGNDIANQWAEKVVYDPTNPNIAPGTPLSQAASQIFPNTKTVSLSELRGNPSAISGVTGVDIPPQVAKHITPYIEKTFPRDTELDMPIVLAHKVDSNLSTGNMMGGLLKAGTVSTQPIYAMERAWDALMTKKANGAFPPNYRFNVGDFTKEIDFINRQLSTDYYNKLYRYRRLRSQKRQARKPEEPKYLMVPKRMMGGDGLISWSHSALTGDPLLGTVTTRTVLDPSNGSMFQMGMDRLALGAGGGKLGTALSNVAEVGMKQHFISLTPKNMSFSEKTRKKWGLDRSSLGVATKPAYEQSHQTMKRLIDPALHYVPSRSKILKKLGRNVGVPYAQQYGRLKNDRDDFEEIKYLRKKIFEN